MKLKITGPRKFAINWRNLKISLPSFEDNFVVTVEMRLPLERFLSVESGVLPVDYQIVPSEAWGEAVFEMLKYAFDFGRTVVEQIDDKGYLIDGIPLDAESKKLFVKVNPHLAKNPVSERCQWTFTFQPRTEKDIPKANWLAHSLMGFFESKQGYAFRIEEPLETYYYERDLGGGGGG
jgi:hypothetical protein